MDRFVFLNYLRNLTLEGGKSHHVTPWRSAVIRNVNIHTGELFLPKVVSEYKHKESCMWIELKAAVFRDNQGTYGVLCCNDKQCTEMHGLLDLRTIIQKE